LNELFKAKWSENLAGGLLESFGRLFKEGITLLVFPWKNRKTGEMVTADTFQAPENCVQLYRHFIDNQRIKGIPLEDESLLSHTGRDISKMILSGSDEWKKWVPEPVWMMAERHAKILRD
jgi:hypothetical protein